MMIIVTSGKEEKCKSWYQVKISKRFAALENLDDDMDIIGAWEPT
jgi:hypothetical protein